jgi:anti-anti-sigma regulatory factor
MVSAWKQARQAGGDLRLAAPQEPVLRLLSLTDLTGLLPVLASVDQAALSPTPGIESGRASLAS